MTRFQFRIGDTTLNVGLEPLMALAALACAIVLMTMYVSTLHVAVSRGEQLREAQRAGPTLETPKLAALSAPR